MASQASRTQSQLCSDCQRVLYPFQNDFTRSDRPKFGDIVLKGSHHKTRESFIAAAEGGCAICHLLWRHHERSNGTHYHASGTKAEIQVGLKHHHGFLEFEVIQAPSMWSQSGRSTNLSFELHTDANELQRNADANCQEKSRSESIDESSVLQYAAKWLKSCTRRTEKHENCPDAFPPRFRPPRLLKISSSSVVLSKNTSIPVLYCALSYCWGTETEKTLLTVENEQDFCAGLSRTTLPRTIRDAVRITEILGIDYIWVDRLCIVQDGDGGRDWRLHCGLMDEIYSNCLLNLSADRAASANEGFLKPRSWPAIRSIFSTCQLVEDVSAPPIECVLILINICEVIHANEPLGLRGWVLSERLLSPRTLHFCSGEMFWECGHDYLASESYPNGLTFFTDISDYTRFDALGRDDGTLIDRWIGLLTNYTRLSISYPDKDKLVTLAGVFKRYQQIRGETTVAGILESALPSSLLWTCRSPALAKRSAVCRAPSWSWASVDGPLDFTGCSPPFDHTHIARVLNIWVSSVDPSNSLGQIEDGAITVEGPAHEYRDLARRVDDMPRGERVRISMLWDVPHTMIEEKTALVLFLAERPALNMVSGLILSPGQENDQWVRVGAANLVWDFADMEDHEQEAFSSFAARFDLGCRRTVTII